MSIAKTIVIEELLLRKPRLSRYFFVILSLLLANGLISCRTSQQTRRGRAPNVQRNGSPSAIRDQDSILLVQQKLISLIDTMTEALAQDQSRIRELELQVAHLSRGAVSLSSNAGIGSYPLPPPSGAIVPGQQIPLPPLSSSFNAGPANNGDQVYNQAVSLFNERKYSKALASFNQLLNSEPNSRLRPNFEYWKGESLYGLGRYTEAARSFYVVSRDYPQSTKAAPAAFKLAESYEKAGNTSNARMAYQRFLADFPNSEFRARAETRLQHLP